MKISDHVKSSLDAADAGELDKAMLFACLAVDGTAKKTYGRDLGVRERFCRFINEHLDVVELMHGGLNLRETVFPFKTNQGNVGLAFADLVYEKFRCSLAHGDELPEGFGISVQIADGHQQFVIDIHRLAMTLPQSVIYALGLPCVLAPVNSDQRIGSYAYFYRDRVNTYVVDRWWGKIECARMLMDFEQQVKVKIDFSNVWPQG